jgi:DNA repair ATPase RecN
VNLKLVIALLVIIALPICAQAQKPTLAQKVLTIISGDKAKTRVYCDMAMLGEQMERANENGDSNKFDELFQKISELEKQLGPEYAALIDGLQDIDPRSEEGQEIQTTLDALDSLCRG